MSRHIKNAQTLGVGTNQLGNLFEARGLSNDTLYRLNQQRFEPFFPSEGVIEKFSEISRLTGQSNPFLEAQGVLQSMRNSFKSQNLNRPLSIDLGDFLPSADTSPEQTPTTPMPNASILTPPIQQIASSQNGLTPTEVALLSPEEQQMRLRQRGLA